MEIGFLVPKTRWCGWDLSPAWFLVSRQRTSGVHGVTLNRGAYKLLFFMAENNKPVVEEKDHDEDKSEVLGNLVKVVVLIWSASLLTFSYVRLPNGQKILDFDPTFIASVFSGSLAAFGLSPAKSGGGNGNANKKKKEEPPVVSAVEPK